MPFLSKQARNGELCYLVLLLFCYELAIEKRRLRVLFTFGKLEPRRRMVIELYYRWWYCFFLQVVKDRVVVGSVVGEELQRKLV